MQMNFLNFRWLRKPIFGAMALATTTMMFAGTGTAQAAQRGDWGGRWDRDPRYVTIYRNEYRPADRYHRGVVTRVYYRGNRRIVTRVIYQGPRYHRDYRYDR
jgi:hypothetical protein